MRFSIFSQNHKQLFTPFLPLRNKRLIMKKKKITQALISALMIISISVQAQDSLFISEVIDPADDYSGRFIELYNTGSETIDFNTLTFYLSRQSNGGTSWGDVQLTGAVAAGETFVIGGSAFESIYGFAPDLETGILIGNGNDAYCLYRDGDHIGGILTDIYGVINVDGSGELWEYTDSRALRAYNVRVPNTTWNNTEWEITPANVADGTPGTHNVSSGFDTIPSPENYSLSILNETVNSYQTFKVHITVSELTLADNIISYQFDIDFNSSVLEYTGHSLAGTLADGGTLVSNTDVAGIVSVAYMNSTAITGAGDILTLQFNSLEPDTTEVFITNAFLNDTPVLELTHATVIIRENEPPTAVITYSDTVNRYADTLIITASFSEAMSAGDPVSLTFNGAVNMASAEMTRLNDSLYNYIYPIPKADGYVNLSFSSGRDISGNELVSIPTSGENFNIIAFIPGDVNDDGIVQAFDAALTLQYSVGIDPLPDFDPLPWEPWRDSTANVDATGGITAYDAGMILQYSIGIISDFSTQSKKSTSLPEVTVDLQDNYIVFSSYGELLGLNVNVTNEHKILGTPEILVEDYMSAFNINDSNYKIGVCTATPPPDGTAFMRIPFYKTGSVTFNMIVNTKESNLSLDFAVGMSEQKNEHISIYPNPATEKLRISGLTGQTYARIYNIHGQQLLASKTEVINGELNVSFLSSGFYIIKLETCEGVFVERFSIR